MRWWSKTTDSFKLMKSPSHYARPTDTEFCDDPMCDHCRIGKRVKAAAVALPEDPAR